MGRAKSDVTGWVDYYCAASPKVLKMSRSGPRKRRAAGAVDASPLLRTLDPRQRKALELFRQQRDLTSREIEKLFSVSPAFRPQSPLRLGPHRLYQNRQPRKKSAAIRSQNPILEFSADHSRSLPASNATDSPERPHPVLQMQPPRRRIAGQNAWLARALHHQKFLPNNPAQRTTGPAQFQASTHPPQAPRPRLPRRGMAESPPVLPERRQSLRSRGHCQNQ